MADPNPVRRAEGRVPRQKDWIALGAWAISRIVMRREREPDCWTRVLRRSAGWSITAESRPELSPAAKWNAGGVRLEGSEGGTKGSYRLRTLRAGCHLTLLLF